MLALKIAEKITMYVASRSDSARTLSDEVDIGVGVRYMSISERIDRPEVAIRQPGELSRALRDLMRAGRVHRLPKIDHDNDGVSILLYLNDGLIVGTNYNVDANLIRGRFRPPRALANTIRELLGRRPMGRR